MKEGWKYCKLSEVCKFFSGFAFKSNKFTEEGMPIIRISDIQNNKIDDSKVVYFNPTDYSQDLSRYIIYPGEILIAMSGGTTGKIGKNETYKQFYLNQRVGAFRENKEILNHDFLYYYLQTKSEESLKIAAGAAQPNLSTSQINNYIIPVPPLSEQQRIVSRLDASFAKIDALTKQAEESVEHAKALFQAKLKELMEKKEGWEEKKLKDIGLTQTGTTPSKADKTNYGDYIPFIRPSEIDCDSMGNIEYNSELMLSEQGVSKGRLFKKHSILMVCIGATIGKVGFCTKDVSCNQQINVLTPKDQYNYKYIYYAMLSPIFRNEVIKQGTSAQATLPIINKGKWEQLTIPIPPLSEQQQIVQTLDFLSERIQEIQQIYNNIIANCQALKQAILKETFE